MHRFALAGMILLVAACGSAPGSDSTSANDSVGPGSVAPDQPANFYLVSTGIYRGGHPDSGGLQYLKNLGITTIVDLEIGDLVESTPAKIDAEIAGATAIGMNDIREPMSAFELALSSSFNDKINQILSILADPTQKPVYVHCLHGQDRTGLVIGLERVINEGWTPAAAWSEMLERGFHPGFLGLSTYFFRRTGWNPTDSGGGSSVDAGADEASSIGDSAPPDAASPEAGAEDGGGSVEDAASEDAADGN